MNEEIKNIPIEELTEETCLIINGGNKYINPDGPLDSMEEWYFTCYIKELIEAGIALDADKNNMPIELFQKQQHISTEYMKTKTKIKPKLLFNPVYYKPDFNIQWSPKWKDIFFSLINRGKHVAKHNIPFISCNATTHSSIIECKGKFMTMNEKNLYSMKLKWAFDKHNIYIQMVKIPDLFKETFTPQAYIDDMKYKVGNKNKGVKVGDSRLKYKVLTCKEYVELIKDKNPENQIEMI